MNSNKNKKTALEFLTENKSTLSIYLFGFLIFLVSLLFFQSGDFKASIIGSKGSDTFATNCAATATKNLYVGDSLSLSDTFHGSSSYDWMIHSINVLYHDPYGFVSSLSAFNQPSNLKPKGYTADIVVLNNASLQTKSPTGNPVAGQLHAQVTYQVNRIYAPLGDYLDVPGNQWYVNGTPFSYGASAHPNFTNGTPVSDLECVNIYFSWCGDGIKNGPEECDGGVNCDSSCKIVASPAPVCATTFGQCSAGTSSNLSDTACGTNDTWTCTSGTQTKTCSLPDTCPLTPKDGECGTSDGKIFDTRPSANLCVDSTISWTDSSASDGTWNWKCLSTSGGAPDFCTASKSPELEPEEPECGTSHTQTFDSIPSTNLCETGEIFWIDQIGNGNTWDWLCRTSSSTTRACYANKTTSPDPDPIPDPKDGICGTSHTQTFDSIPSTNLCDFGNLFWVDLEAKGETWDWLCKGEEGTLAAPCYANKTTSPDPEPTPEPVDGVCGTASGITSLSAPTQGFCSVGNFAWTDLLANDGDWNWTCSGSDGGLNSFCLSYKHTLPNPEPTPSNGKCGDAHLSTLPLAPAQDFCEIGTASAVTGEGPWTWTCSGLSGGESATCLANPVAEEEVDGVCGSSDGIATLSQPNSGFCSAGTFAHFEGNGPWSWLCIGVNGGKDADCKANKTILHDSGIVEDTGARGYGTYRWYDDLCGNGKIDYKEEECDDGNKISSDGCSRFCNREKVCGDGILDKINFNGQKERCDDGNTKDGDGCSSICKIEKLICGNGILQKGEQCDDGNNTSGDGCSSVCLFEGGMQICGNGKLEWGEECDDGNQNNNDRCNNVCLTNEQPQVKEVGQTGPATYLLVLFTLLGALIWRRFRKLKSS